MTNAPLGYSRFEPVARQKDRIVTSIELAVATSMRVRFVWFVLQARPLVRVILLCEQQGDRTSHALGYSELTFECCIELVERNIATWADLKGLRTFKT